MKKTALFLAVAMVVLALSGVQAAAAAGDITLNNTYFTVSPKTSETISVTATNASDENQTVTVGLGGTALGAGLTSGYSDITMAPDSSFGISISVYADEDYAGTSQDLPVIFYDSDGRIINAVILKVSVRDTASSAATEAPEAKPELKMTAPDSYVQMKPGVSQTVSVKLKNITSHSANNISIYAKPSADFAFTRTDSDSVFHLYANSEKTLEFEITPDSDLEAGNYTLSFDYSCVNKYKETFTGTAEIMVKVIKDSTSVPKVILSGFSVDPQAVAAGSGFTVNAQLKNGGAADAENVQVYLTELSTDGITVSNTSSSLYTGSLKAGGSQNVSFSFNTSSKMATGSYPLNFTVKYNAGGTDYEDSFSYFVTVNAADEDEDRARLEITSITNPSGIYGVNEDIPVTVTIKNTGTKAAANVKTSAAPEEGLVPKSASSRVVNALEPGAETTLQFSFAASATAKSQSYTVGFTVDYETGRTDSAGAKLTDSFMQYIGAYVSNPDADEEDDDTMKSVPKIIISDYTLDPLIVMAGANFELDIEFQNTHSSKTISNIKVTMKVLETETEKGNIFTPVDTSNTFYIERIDPKGTTQHHITMYTVPDASARNYTITVTFEYEDEEGTAITATEEIGVNVKQVSRLELGEASIPTEMNVGQRANVYFTVHNTGKVTLSNLKIKMEGEGIDPSGSEMIFGNFVSGSYDYYDGDFTVTGSGPCVVRIIASYDDDTGEHQEYVDEYTFTGIEEDYSYEEGEYFPGEGEMTDEGSGLLSNPWFWTGVGAAALIGLAAAILIIRRVRKNKRQKDMDFYE